MGRKNYFGAGFTLLDLILVIAFLGIISAFLIATLNPVEQANKARDAQYRADASQLTYEVASYFKTYKNFPWVTEDLTNYPNNDSLFGFQSASSNDLNTLQGIGSLKNSRATLYLGKSVGPSAIVYACYVPSSKSVREAACKDGNVYTLDADTGVRTKVAAAVCAPPSVWLTGSLTTSWVVCVPD